MNLVLDFGNTRIKAAIFEKNALREQFFFDSETDLRAALDELQSKVQNCIIGSVTFLHEKSSELLNKKFRTLVFKAETPIPIKNAYTTALTLGSDRLAASIGAWTLSPSQNVLVIDAGTCIKYNFVNRNNVYEGGAISPGLPMRLKAMNHFTAKLPLVEADKNYNKLTGQNTQESMLAGALLGAACEVDGMIARYSEVYPDLRVYITGGDADYLCKQVKSRFFAHPTLLLQGLNTILNYNLEK